jgi:hypothetical protein
MSNQNDPGLLEELSLLKEDLYNREHWSQADYDWYGRTRPVLTDEELSRLGRWKRSVQPRLVIKDEQRQFKIMRLAEKDSYPLVIVGLPQYEPKQLGKAVSPRVMPTAQEHRIKIDRDGEVEHVHTNRMRLSCTKWQNPVIYKRTKTGRGGKTTPSTVALADLERRLGIKIG